MRITNVQTKHIKHNFDYCIESEESERNWRMSHADNRLMFELKSNKSYVILNVVICIAYASISKPCLPFEQRSLNSKWERNELPRFNKNLHLCYAVLSLHIIIIDWVQKNHLKCKLASAHILHACTHPSLRRKKRELFLFDKVVKIYMQKSVQENLHSFVSQRSLLQSSHKMVFIVWIALSSQLKL